MPALEALGSLLAALKQVSPAVLLATAISSGAVLFGGDGFARSLGVMELRDHYRLYLGIAFLGATSLLVALGLSGAGDSVLAKFRDQRVLKRRLKSLHELTPDEKAYLAPYILEQENTQYFQAEDGVVGGLAGKQILYQASSVGGLLTGFAYNMQPWAREHLTRNPRLLEGANPDPQGPPDLYGRGR